MFGELVREAEVSEPRAVATGSSRDSKFRDDPVATALGSDTTQPSVSRTSIAIAPNPTDESVGYSRSSAALTSALFNYFSKGL